MSARRSGHLALAVAGLIGGLPAAAVLQWTRPVPTVVWLEVAPPANDVGNASVPCAMATRPGGPRLTVLSEPRVPVTGSLVGAPFSLHPAPFYVAATRIGITTPWRQRAFIPDELRPVISRSPGVVGRWHRGTVSFRVFMPMPMPVLPATASDPK